MEQDFIYVKNATNYNEAENMVRPCVQIIDGGHCDGSNPCQQSWFVCLHYMLESGLSIDHEWAQYR